MLNKLEKQDRLQLMKFVCAFAWADLKVEDEERNFVGKLIDRLGLEEDEVEQVQKWLEVPPKAEEIDPNEIPVEHRQLFIDAARAMVVVDGKVDADEAENLALLEQLIE